MFPLQIPYIFWILADLEGRTRKLSTTDRRAFSQKLVVSVSFDIVKPMSPLTYAVRLGGDDALGQTHGYRAVPGSIETNAPVPISIDYRFRRVAVAIPVAGSNDRDIRGDTRVQDVLLPW